MAEIYSAWSGLTHTDFFASSTIPRLHRRLIEFFSPYCHHCQKFAPTWGALAEMHGHLADSHNFHLARVNCVAQGGEWQCV